MYVCLRYVHVMLDMSCNSVDKFNHEDKTCMQCFATRSLLGDIYTHSGG